MAELNQLYESMGELRKGQQSLTELVGRMGDDTRSSIQYLTDETKTIRADMFPIVRDYHLSLDRRKRIIRTAYTIVGTVLTAWLLIKLNMY